MMKPGYFIQMLFLAMLFTSCESPTQETKGKKDAGFTELRAPAYPLITIDPYTSAWSFNDKLYNGPIRHWTGTPHSLIGALRVDGKVYRFMGKEDIPWKTIVPMASSGAWVGKYMLTEPSKGWENTDFDDSSWKAGKGAFGTDGMPEMSTLWNTKDIWVRREINLPTELAAGQLYVIYSHDDIFELYLNGEKLVGTGYEWKNNQVVKINQSQLHPTGKNVIAAHCHNRTGGGYVDFGIVQENNQQEVFSQTAEQKSVTLSATQTKYQFTCGQVDLTLHFVSPLLLDDLDLMSRPVNYINYEVVSNDGQKHDVQIFIEATPEWAVNEVSQEVVVETGENRGIAYVKAGTTEQPILQKKGDNVRIDWGYFYLATAKSDRTSIALGNYFDAKNAFAEGTGYASLETRLTTKMTETMPSLAFTDQLGEVSETPSGGYAMIAYDDIESIQYFGDNLKAWWRKGGEITINDALQIAAKDHDVIIDRCAVLDAELWESTMKAGGKNYADLCVLAYRQSIAAHKLVRGVDGEIIFLSKENFSNGSVGTVDLTYPSAPLYLIYNPDLLKGMMNPIFYYSESGKWAKPFAAHDVGTYPQANGQTYGTDMPVEESGNMLILATAIAEVEGNADYAEKHWEVLTTWADYLLEKGLDPENQLSTDDFAGHMAHNVNLSVKAINGIAGYGRLAKMLGKNEIAEKYTSNAKNMAKKWMEMADDGDHYRLAFDQPGTWSQKYNLVWDDILELDVFPDEVAQKEVAYYLTKQNKYGLPLDNRADYTKTDWIVWSAALADDMETFQKIIDPLHDYITETPNRVPMSDWYDTKDAVKLNFQARSVVGAYFIKVLEEKLKKK